MSNGQASSVGLAESAPWTGVSGESQSERASKVSDPRSESGFEGAEPDASAEFNLGGVTAEVTDAFYHWEVTNGLYDVIDTVTSPGVGLPERAPEQKHVFLRLRLAEGAKEPALVRTAKEDEAKTRIGGLGEDAVEGGVPRAEVDAERLSKCLTELGLETKEGVPRSFLTMAGASLIPGKKNSEVGESGRNPPDESMTSAACRDPGALLVRLGGSPVQRLLGLSSAHTFAAALGRRLVAWWPADVASAGLTFGDLFEGSEVEVRTGSGPVLHDVSGSGTGSGSVRRHRGRVLLEEPLGDLSDQEGRESGHEVADNHQRKNKMLVELLQRVEARRALEAKEDASHGGAEKAGGERAETGDQRGVVKAEARATRLIESETNGERVEEGGAIQERVGNWADLGEGSVGQENAEVVEAVGVEREPAAEQGRETVGSEGSSSLFSPHEVEVMSSAPAADGKAHRNPIGMLDLDSAGQGLPVIEPLPRGGLAWYAWDPPAWDVGAPVVPLASAVGKHLLLNLNGTLPALGDHFAFGGVPGWKHRALQLAQDLADVLSKVRKALLVTGDGEEARSNGIREKDSGTTPGVQKDGEQGSIVLFVNDDMLGGCGSLDAALDQMLQMMPNQNDPQAKSRLLERLKIVTRGDPLNSGKGSTPQSELGLGSSGAGGSASHKKSNICVEVTELARKLVTGTHTQSQPRCVAMPDCRFPSASPAGLASEEDLTLGADTLLKRSEASHSESLSTANARRGCLLKELAVILVVSEGAERVFSFEVAAAVDLAVAWGPGSKGFHRLACPKTPP